MYAGHYCLFQNGVDTMILIMSEIRFIISECSFKMIRTYLLVETSP